MAVRSVLFSSRWCRFVAEERAAGDPYYMLEVPDYVTVIARTADGRIPLVRQFRPVVNDESIELPSGHVDPGERPEDAARRELLEETGMIADRLELLGVLVPDIGRLVNRMWCYFAPDVSPSGRPIDPHEGITPLEVPEQEALAMAADGRIAHALNLSALFLAISRRKLRLA